ncbi:hypothetical protein AB0C38_13755 [Amycolatopsis sp. NPDC048633]
MLATQIADALVAKRSLTAEAITGGADAIEPTALAAQVHRYS